MWYLLLDGAYRDGFAGLTFLYRSAELITWEYLHPFYEGTVPGERWLVPDFPVRRPPHDAVLRRLHRRPDRRLPRTASSRAGGNSSTTGRSSTPPARCTTRPARLAVRLDPRGSPHRRLPAGPLGRHDVAAASAFGRGRRDQSRLVGAFGQNDRKELLSSHVPMPLALRSTRFVVPTPASVRSLTGSQRPLRPGPLCRASPRSLHGAGSHRSLCLDSVTPMSAIVSHGGKHAVDSSTTELNHSTWIPNEPTGSVQPERHIFLLPSNEAYDEIVL